MSDILFLVRTFVLTVAVVMVMQINVGERTIENHALAWVQTSPVVAPLNHVAKGAAKLVKDAVATVKQNIKNPFR